MKVFISGSISIKTLTEIALAQLNDFVQKVFTILN